MARTNSSTSNALTGLKVTAEASFLWSFWVGLVQSFACLELVDVDPLNMAHLFDCLLCGLCVGSVFCLSFIVYAGERWSERAFFFELTSPNSLEAAVGRFLFVALRFAKQTL